MQIVKLIITVICLIGLAVSGGMMLKQKYDKKHDPHYEENLAKARQRAEDLKKSTMKAKDLAGGEDNEENEFLDEPIEDDGYSAEDEAKLDNDEGDMYEE